MGSEWEKGYHWGFAVAMVCAFCGIAIGWALS